MRGVLFCIIFLPFFLSSQEYTWKGSVDNDFFNEYNWLDTNGLYPPISSINPGQDINFKLILTCNSFANGVIKLDAGSVDIINSTLTAEVIDGGIINMFDNSYIELTDSIAIRNNPYINFISPISFVKVIEISASTIFSNYLSSFYIYA